MANNPNQKPSPTVPSSTPEYANKQGNPSSQQSSKASPSKSSPDSSKSSPSSAKDQSKMGGGNCGC